MNLGFYMLSLFWYVKQFLWLKKAQENLIWNESALQIFKSMEPGSLFESIVVEG